MKGALVFLAVFALLIVLTIYGPWAIPPGFTIYGWLNVPWTTYLIANLLPASLFAVSVINGAVYGIIAWIIFSIAMMGSKKKDQTVVVNVSQNNYPQAPPPPQ
jgi:hypothetical protein